MDESYLKLLIFFGLAFVWIYFINIALVWLLCHRERTKPGYRLIFMSHAAISIVGFCFIAKVFEIIQQISSLPRVQRLLLGISLVVINLALPMAISALTIKYFFPGKWDKFLKIRSLLFAKSDDSSHDKNN